MIALGAGAFASHMTTKAAMVLPRPAGLSAEQAAALPLASRPAWYALEKVARLQRGERVLIHAATGGVGQMAVQWAQHVGAEVYCDGGLRRRKRAYLRVTGGGVCERLTARTSSAARCRNGRGAREWTWCSTRCRAG